MPATGRRISRRTLLAQGGLAVGGLAMSARADDAAAEAWDVLTRMAAALGRGNANEFLRFCEPSLPGYPVLRTNVTALAQQAEAESSIDPVRNEGNDSTRDLEVNWSLRLVGRSGIGRVTNRRTTVTVRLARRTRGWRAVELAPVDFFAPPSA
jgi:hypothetical protein